MADLGEHGLALLNAFEPGPGGKPATTAYECSGGRYTLGLGATEWPNGTPIGPTDFCTPEQAIELTNWHLRRFAKAVDRVITRPMTVNQRDAFIMLAFNIGEHAFEFNCSAARMFNEGATNLEVAAAFGKWCKATNDVPDKTDLDDPYFMPVIGRNAKGQACWVDREGKPCEYQKAMPGLLRRHLSEACLFLDLDWRQACTKKAISIICERVWDDRDNHWEDIVRKKTELADILPLAKQYPLDLVLTQPASPRAADEVAQRQSDPARSPAAGATIAKPSATVSGPVEAAPVAPPVPAPQPTPARPAPASVPAVIPAPVGTKAKSPNTVAPADVPYKIDPNAGLKPLEESDRAKGYWYQQAGIGMIRLGSLGVFGTTVQGGAQVLQGDPVLSNLVLTGVVVGGIAATGYVIKAYGDWRRKRGEKAAVQALY